MDERVMYLTDLDSGIQNRRQKNIKRRKNISMGKSYSAGGYIESWCTTCKLELGHTIVAMVGEIPHPVMCNTCKGTHKFRKMPSPKKSSTPSVGAKKVNVSEYLSRLNSADTTAPKPYNIKDNFEEDEIIKHPIFGIGFVAQVITLNKVKAIFSDGTKLLLQNK
ncbi:MAG: hypothetical protein ACE5FU_07020 [Nitrospinota bacterium]